MRHYGKIAAIAAVSAAASATAAITPPYTPTFTSSSSLTGYTIIDANGDGNTWTYYKSDGSLMAPYGTVEGDDWAITPAIELEAGKSYLLSFDAYCRNPANAERLAVTLGAAATADAMTTTIMAATEIAASSDEPYSFSAYVTPETSGEYYIGFHSVSDANRYFLHVLNISLAAGVSHEVPGVAQNLTLSFEGSSLSGTVAFTAPSTTFGGTEASGEIGYTALINGDTLAAATTSYGADVSLSVTVPASGSYTFSVTLSNSAGDSPATEASTYIGFDTPQAPASAQASWSDGVFTVTWDKVTLGVNGGYMNADNVAYSLTRYPDYKVVASALTDTAYLDPVEAGEAVYYSYGVTASADGMTSDTTPTNEVGVGYFVPPFEPTFSSEDETIVGMFTIIDANDDGRTWQYKRENTFYARSNTANAADDWLMTPGLKLEFGKTYQLSYCAWGQNSTRVVTYEVKYGQSPEIASMTYALVDTTERTGNLTTEVFSAYITPEKDGIYYVGFHNLSAKSTTDMLLGSIVVAAGVTLEVPDSVSNLTVVPDNTTRDPRCTVTFVAPTASYLGSDLDSLTMITVKRDDTVVATIESPALGDTITLTDTASSTGTYTYTVTPYNSYGAGRQQSQSVYLGINVTTAVPSISVSEPDQDGKVTFTWEAPATDIAGFPTNPEFITYTIEKVGTTSNTTIVKQTSANTYTYQAVSASATQDFLQWTIYAITDGGTSEALTTDQLPIGTPYSMPFTESFPDGTASHDMLVQAHYGSSSTWNLYNDDEIGLSSYDGDNGFAAMRGYYKYYSAGLYSGKVLIEGEHPALSLYAYRIEEGSEDVFEIYARAGDAEWELLDSVAMDDFGANTGWRRLTMFLDDYVGQALQFRFDATTYSKVYHPIDLIEVKSLPADNLVVDGIVCPTDVEPNEAFTLDVTVRNIGCDAASGYSVELYRDGELHATAAGDSLAAGERVVVTFDEALTVTTADSVSYYAIVTYAADGDTSDNQSDVYTIAFNQYDYPAVSDLTAEKTDAGAALAWSVPDISGVTPDRVTDDFESYDSWVTTAGDWIFVDVDQSPILALYNITYPEPKYDGMPKWGTLQSWWIMDWSYDGLTNFKSYSGYKCMISLGRYDDGQVDDWAISPELYGGEQTITFYARSFNNAFQETVQVLYSTSGTDVDDFTPVETFDSLSSVYTLISCDIPDGAKYFALRSCATNGQALLIDDVSYIPDAVSGIAIEGYNVYRDGDRVNSQTLTGTSYVDSDFPGSAEYVVSVVYNYGESRPSNSVWLDESGVETARAASTVTIAAANRSIIITGACGETVGVYSVDGKVIYSGVAQDATTVPVSQGVYIVRAGAASAKVMVP